MRALYVGTKDEPELARSPWRTDTGLHVADALGQIMNATPHHIGCAVNQLENSCATYADAFDLTRRTRSFDITSQHVRICFVELANSFYLELITPLNDKARLASFFRIGFYHLCFLVEDLGAAREHLIAQRFFPLHAFESEAFDGNLCQFFLSPQKHLIELAQMSTPAFGEFFRANLAGET
jgi:methylmalonyl-CoA/ethylmalonyl-CoA epimerase